MSTVASVPILDVSARAIGGVRRRLIPFLALLYFVGQRSRLGAARVVGSRNGRHY